MYKYMLVNIMLGIGGAFSEVPGALLQRRVNIGTRSWDRIGRTDSGHVGCRCVTCRFNGQQ